MVSIILPYDKDRGYLQRMIDSIEAQTYEDIELIKVHSPSSVAVNFNVGLGMAQGEWVKVVGEDDWLPPTSIQDLVDGIGSHPWACANAVNVIDGRYEPEYILDLGKLNLQDMAINNVIHGGTTLYRREILEEIGGLDESLWTGEEYDMNMNLMSKGYMPVYIDKSVYFYQMGSHQKSRIYRRKDPVKREAMLNYIRQRYANIST